MAEVDSNFLDLRGVFLGKVLEVPNPEGQEEIQGELFQPTTNIYFGHVSRLFLA